MKKEIKVAFQILATTFALSLINVHSQAQQNADVNIDYCRNQVMGTLKNIPTHGFDIPRSIVSNTGDWKYVNYKDWCSGFWPGVLWYVYEGTNDHTIKIQAGYLSRNLALIGPSVIFS